MNTTSVQRFTNKLKFDPITLLASFVFIGNLCAIITCVINSQIFKLTYPYNTYLFRPDDRFMDFFNPLRVASSPYLQPVNAQWQQMPFFYFLTGLLKLLPHNLAFVLTLSIFWVSLAIICFLAIHTNNYWKTSFIAFILLTSYPVVFILDRGNLEMLFFLCLFIILILLKKRLYTISSLILAGTMAFKPFAIFLLPLFLYKKRYLECIAIPIAAVLITVISMTHFPGSVLHNYHNWMRNLTLYNSDYALNLEGIIGGNSIFGAIKLSLLIEHYPATLSNMQAGLQAISQIYFYGTILLMVLISYFIIRFRFEFWKKVALLICCMNMFPTVSGDYRLIQFFIPLYFWLQSIRQRSKQETNGNTPQPDFTYTDYIYALLFALLLIPRNYYHFWGTELTTAVYTSPAIMLFFTSFIFIDYYLSNRQSNNPPNESHSELKLGSASIKS